VTHADATINDSKLIFGNDILRGGAGNDYLAGDAVNFKGLDKFLTGSNTLTWGDDMLTGGTGADKFAFTLLNDGHLEMQGKDTITDFKVSEGDRMVLKVAAGVNYAQINADTVFSHSSIGGGAALDTIATFFDGSSITLLDANIASFSAANTVLVQ
jgi:serralysin